MKIVNSTDILEELYGPERTLEILADAGFEAFDYTMNELTYKGDGIEILKRYKAASNRLGLPFVQAHGPMPANYQLWETERREEFFRRVKIALEAAAFLGAENLVLHPMRVKNGTHEEQLAINLGEYERFVPLAESLGVNIAIENMCGTKPDIDGNQVEHVCKTGEELARYVDAFGSKRVKACLDTGHAGCSGKDIAEFARTLGGERIASLHIHDNDLLGDLHSIPYNHKIDFAPFLKVLAEIDYKGDFTLECIYHLRKLPEPLYISALKYMRDVAAYMRDEVMKHKKSIVNI